jgi:hypothetical protein
MPSAAGSGVASDRSGASADEEAGEGDEDLPVWSTLSKTFEKDIAAAKNAKMAEQTGGAAEQPAAEPPPESQTERVLRLFRGTIVKDIKAE